MDTPIKAYVFLYLMQFLIIFGISNINSQLQISNAQNFAQDAVREIENSNYNPHVINHVIKQSQTNGYEMEIVVYFSDRSFQTYHLPNVAYDSKKDVVMARITMDYENTNAFTGYRSVKQIRRFSQ